MKRAWKTDLLVALLLVGAGTFVCAFELFGHFQIGWTYEFSEYGDMARSLAEHGTLTTHFAQPMDIAFLEKQGMALPPWPMTHRFPLFPALLAVAFSIFGPSDEVTVFVTSLTASACAVLTYFAGRRLFNRHEWVPAIAAGLLVLNPIFSVYFSMCGYTEFLFSAFVLASFARLAPLLAGDRPALLDFGMAGFFGGLAYLSRLNFMVLLPVVALMVAFHRPAGARLRPIAAYLFGFALLALPWSLYRSLTVGPVASRDFVANLADVTGQLPWLDRRVLTFGEVLREHGRAILLRGASNLVRMARWFFVQYEMFWLVPLSLAGGWSLLFVEDKKDPRRNFAALYGLAFLAQVAFFAFLRVEPQGRYFIWIAPAMALLGTEAYFDLLARLKERAKSGVHAVSIVLLCGWAVFQLEYNAAPVTVPIWEKWPPWDEAFPEIAKRVPPEARIISNIGVHIGWYSKRYAIDLPNTIEEMIQLAKDYDVRWVVIAFWPQGEVSNRPVWAQYFTASDWQAKLGQRIKIKSSFVFIKGVLLEVDPHAPLQ